MHPLHGPELVFPLSSAGAPRPLPRAPRLPAFREDSAGFGRGHGADFSAAGRGATELAVAGEAVLLGAGFVRFNLFQNHEDRGDQFESLARSLGEPLAHRGPPAFFSPFTQPTLNPSLL